MTKPVDTFNVTKNPLTSNLVADVAPKPQASSSIITKNCCRAFGFACTASAVIGVLFATGTLGEPQKKPELLPQDPLPQTTNPSSFPTYLRSSPSSLAPTSGSPQSNPPSKFPTSLPQSKQPTLFPTSKEAIKEAGVVNETPYFLKMTDSWYSGIGCSPTPCLSQIAPDEEQRVSEQAGSASYGGGIDYNLYSDQNLKKYITHVSLRFTDDNASLKVTMPNNGQGTVELVQASPSKYLIQMVSSQPHFKPTSAPSKPSFPTLFPSSLAPSPQRPSYQPTTASPSVSHKPSSNNQKKIELSTWYIDWTSWFNGAPYSIPSNVNVINVFVGKFTLDSNGKPTLGGFGNLNSDQLKEFVNYCKSQPKPIDVKVSVGGGGGSYDNTWNSLTADNINDYAKGIIDFCHDHGLAGVDLDYEESPTVAQEKLVGQLIKALKTFDQDLQVTMCANAGFGPNYPWESVVETILDNAVITKGDCPIDYLYAMTYYNPMPQEQQWALGWRDMLINRYNCPSQALAVGIDFFDSHAYDPLTFAQWAVDNGMSTAVWAANPADPTNINFITSLLGKLQLPSSDA